MEKRFLSLALCLIMLMGMLPTAAFAVPSAGEPKYIYTSWKSLIDMGLPEVSVKQYTFPEKIMFKPYILV